MLDLLQQHWWSFVVGFIVTFLLYGGVRATFELHSARLERLWRKMERLERINAELAFENNDLYRSLAKLKGNACERCGKPLAYPNARFCGAACSAKNEAKSEPSMEERLMRLERIAGVHGYRDGPPKMRAPEPLTHSMPLTVRKADLDRLAAELDDCSTCNEIRDEEE